MASADPISSNASSELSPDHLHVQMNYYDFYTTKPTHLDKTHGSSLPLHQFGVVPVVRVFGSLPTGHRILCHIHGVYPYMFIKYDGNAYDESVVMNQKCAEMHTLFEKRLESTSRANRKQKNQNSMNDGSDLANKILNHVANVSIVKAVPFYGFHVGWSLFYKISFLKPQSLNKLADLLRDGKCFNKVVEVYECHIPYLLQFSADYNLFGCSSIHIDKVDFRKPILNPMLELDQILMNEELKSVINKFYSDSNHQQNKNIPRRGNSLLEIDILPESIRNKDELEFSDLHSNFTEKLNPEIMDPNKKYVSSAKNITNEIEKLRKEYNLPQYRPQSQIEREPTVINWDMNEEWEQLIKEVESKLRNLESRPVDFEKFVYNDKNLSLIKTPSESLGELLQFKSNKILQDEVQQKNFGETIDQTIMDKSYLIVHDDSNSKDSEIIHKADDNGQITDNEIKLEEPSSEIAEESKDAEKVFSMDLNMTQMMALKRQQKHTQSQIILSSSIKRIKFSNNQSGIQKGQNGYVYDLPPVSFDNILLDLENQGYPKVDYMDPYFSNPIDLSKRPYIYSGRRFEIRSCHLQYRLPVIFNNEEVLPQFKTLPEYYSSWKYLPRPPSYIEVKKAEQTRKRNFESQLSKNTASNRYMYKIPSAPSPIKIISKYIGKLSHFTLEVIVTTRADKLPDPKLDNVVALLWKIDEKSYPFDLNIATEGIMIVPDKTRTAAFINVAETCITSVTCSFYDTESDMIDALIDLVLFFDPDILSGYELHSLSWGFIIERWKAVYNIDLRCELSRISNDTEISRTDKWAQTHTSNISIVGRHMINVWRAMKSEVTLNQYTIENLSYHVLHERLPHYSYQYLTKLWNEGTPVELSTVINYWLTRTRNNIKLIEKQEYIERTTEQARMVGIDFYSVYYRGSQYKVESILVRLCKSEHYLLVSPSRRMVREQRPLECVPLVMEPDSAFYKSPLVVLDFQSLYPSIMIAHNYCYSTMLGRLRGMKKHGNEIGVTTLDLDDNILTLLKDDVTISPNGIIFAKSSIRKSTLSKMLKDIMDTRFVVKKTMTDIGKKNITLKKLLNHRQLALKLLSNVTYGYASASFSGRMPSIDLADTIVQTGRETLEKAIELIEHNDEWGAKVVYGDTDSLFVYLPGKTKKESFTIGKEIADAVTKQNPAPIYLKFEKVYYPCILVSKKRYVGYSYEKDSQTEPNFDAKGIETVRRDGHPAQQQITEKCLRIFFDTKDLSLVKSYLLNQFTKIEKGKISIQDFCFAKEVKLGSYKSDITAPAGAHVAMREMELDYMAEPQFRERVPYLVIRGKSGQILRERCISPKDFVANANLELDSEYYITKTLIPPLERLFNVMGINIKEWLMDAPRYKKLLKLRNDTKFNKILQKSDCVNCQVNSVAMNQTLCEKCKTLKSATTANLLISSIMKQKQLENLLNVCRVCNSKFSFDAGVKGSSIAYNCDSYDCPVFYSRIKAQRKFQESQHFAEIQTLDDLNEW